MTIISKLEQDDTFPLECYNCNEVKEMILACVETYGPDYISSIYDLQYLVEAEFAEWIPLEVLSFVWNTKNID